MRGKLLKRDVLLNGTVMVGVMDLLQHIQKQNELWTFLKMERKLQHCKLYNGTPQETQKDPVQQNK